MMRFRPIPTTLSTALLAVAYGYLAYFLFTNQYTGLEAFSWSFVMLLPYTLGVITVYLAKEANQGSLLYAVLMPWFACLVLAVVLVAGTFGLLLCLVISVPILFPAASIGGVSVWLIRKDQRAMMILLLLALLAPYAASPVEAQFEQSRLSTTTHTQIVIDADVETVWNLIKSVSPIQETEQRFDWLHMIGLPRPVAATLSYEGVGGVRDAYFENGLRFDETITEWEYHERIRFDIVETSETLLPAPLNLIDGERFDVVEGMYELEQLEDGTILLHLTSEHFLTSHFNQYGAFWTDLIMRDLQTYILEIIKERAE
ncbi:MAG: hypothetical protein ACPG8W_01510 [Candidatus Promineifilaceae bacterium]